MLRPRFRGAFKKDRKRTGRRGKDLNKLGKLMRRLASKEQLEARFRDQLGTALLTWKPANTFYLVLAPRHP